MWEHIYIKNKEDFSQLGKYIPSDEIIEGLYDEHEIPHIESEQDIHFLLLQAPLSLSRTYPLGVIVGTKAIKTILTQDTPLVSKVTEETKRNDQLFEILYAIEEAYEKTVNVIAKKIRQKKINLSALGNNDIIDLVEVEDSLNNIVTSAVPNINVYERIGKLLKLSGDDADSLLDVIYDARQNVERSRLLLKTTQNIRNAYGMVISNNLNSVLKILTVATVVLAIPTVLASLYGMNTTIPFADNPLTFFIILLISVILSMGLLIYFRVKKWL